MANEVSSATFHGSMGYQQTYTSLPGTQIKCVAAGREMATLQGITVSISAEKAPIFVMGFRTPRGFATNKIGIAGSIVAINTDRDAFWDMKTDDKNKVVSISNAYFGGDSNLTLPTTPDGGINSSNINLNPVGLSDVNKHFPLYSAELKAFDIVLVGMDVSGNGAYKIIRGVELINEGTSTSVDSIINETQATFVAREATSWVPLKTTVITVNSSGIGNNNGGFV